MRTMKGITLIACLFTLGLLTARCTAIELVRNHRPIAVIILPAKSITAEDLAAEELQYHVLQSSGAKLAILQEGATAQISGSAPRIFIGHTNAATAAGVDTSSLPGNSYILKTSGNDLYIVGVDDPGDPLQLDTVNALFPLDKHCGTMFGVYELLENTLGVHWLFPGTLGEVIPSNKSISLPALNSTVQPSMYFKNWRIGISNMPPYNDGNDPESSPVPGFASAALLNAYERDETRWLRRHRFGRSATPTYGHAFCNANTPATNWWTRFGASHPEYFAMDPDGNRGLKAAGGDYMYVHMCVSNPNVVKQLVADWQAAGSPQFINVCENDGLGVCCCPNCMAMDVPHQYYSNVPFSNRLQQAKIDYDQNSNGTTWIWDMGWLSDRYVKFAYAVQAEAAKTRPDVKVVMYGYNNYQQPPVSTPMDQNLLVGLVPSEIFPHDAPQAAALQQLWGSWKSGGCALFLRPNITLQGHDFPYFYARAFCSDLTFGFQNSMMGTDFDSLTGQWSAQGPTLYAIAKTLSYPNETVDGAIDEFASGFGAGKNAIKQYISLCETVTTNPNLPSGSVIGVVAPAMFTPSVMSQLWGYLTTAQTQTVGDPKSSARVAWLAKGLTNAQLTLATQSAYASKSGFSTAYQALLTFRSQNQLYDIANFEGTRGDEGNAWGSQIH